MIEEDFVYTGGTLSFDYGAAPMSLSIYPGGTLATISREGEVAIDWGKVQKCADNPSSDTMQLAYARLMLAIRDGTWIALSTTATSP